MTSSGLRADSSQVEFCAIPSPGRFPPMYDSARAQWIPQEYDSDYSDGPSPAPLAFSTVGEAASAGDGPLTPAAAPGPAPSPESAASGGPTYDFRMLYTGMDAAFTDAMMQRLLRQPDISASVSGAREAGLLQTDVAFDWPLLGKGLDTSFLSAADWDLASEAEESLFLSALVQSVPNLVSPDCDGFRALRDAAAAGGADAGGGDTVLGTVLGGTCMQGTLEAVASAEDLHQRLLCTGYGASEEECPERGQVVTAFNLADSGPGRLHLDIYDRQLSHDTKMRPVAKPIGRVVNSWLQEWLGEGAASRLLAQMGMPQPPLRPGTDVASIFSPLLYIWLIQMPLPWAVVQLVNEKQHRLRSMMRMHGLDNGAYIVVMYAYFMLQFTLFAAVMIGAGAAAGLDLFRRNSVAVQLIFYFLYGNVQVAFAFLLSCLFARTRTANITMWIWILGAGIFAQSLMVNMIVEARSYTAAVQLIPTFGAFRGLWELAEASMAATYNNSFGMTLSTLSAHGNGMGMLWLTFALEAPALLLLAWYLEQVTESGIGVRRPPLFPLHALLAWRRRTGAQQQPPMAGELPSDVGQLGEAMLRERQAAWDTVPSAEAPVVVRDMRKVFRGQDGNAAHAAVKNLSLCVPAGECFGLLGPNGAGKSTSINMMIGYLSATRGDAFINGVNIREDLAPVYAGMGVCPQDNILWETLTAQEHLFFYARLKRLRGARAAHAVEEVLRSVSLYDVRHKRSSTFSGGMKRRLSVAISLIGGPRVVYLDEPSTGLDPAARRQLWDVVQSTKREKAIVLTTHSMEEAEGLCDRIGIFVDGRLVCLGNPKQLAARHVGCYMFTVTTAPDDADRMHEYVLRMSPTAERTYALAGTSKYELQRADTAMSCVFDAMEAAPAAGLDVRDWGLRSPSLEDVFVRITREADTAATDKDLADAGRPDGGTST